MKTRITHNQLTGQDLAAGAAVLTATPTHGLWNEAVVALSITGLDSAASTLTVTLTQGGVADGDALTIAKGGGVTARKAKLTLVPDGSEIVVTVSSDNASDTAVAVDVSLIVESDSVNDATIRSMIQSAAPGLIYAPHDGKTGVRDLCGLLPEPGTAAYESYVMAAAATWKRLCSAAQDGDYYFDAQGGSDSNDGLTPSTPKQTVGEANTLLAAGATRIRLKGRFGPGFIMPANTSITRWGDGSDWEIDGCSLRYEVGELTWTLAAGNRYTTTIANARHLQPLLWGPMQHLTYCTSTADVEATPYSFHVDTGTNLVSINLAGADANLIGVRVNTAADFSGAHGIRVNGGQVFIEGGVIHHCGYGPTSENQIYSVVCYHTGEAVAYIKDCTFAANSLHNFGTLSDNGGRTILENCTAGGCLGVTSTHFNFFSTNGGNEAICLNCRVVTDRMPTFGMTSTGNSQAGWFGHTAANDVSFMAMIGCELAASGQDPAQELGRFNDTPTTTPGDASTFVATFHRCRTAPNPGSRTIPWMNGTAYTSCSINIRPGQNYYLAANVNGGAGLCVATEYDVDWSDVTPGTSDTYGLHQNSQRANVDPTIINSLIRFRGTKSGKRYGIIRLNSTSENLATTAYIANSVFVSDAARTGSTCWLTLGDVESTGATHKNNAVHGFAAGGTGDYGYSAWEDTVALGSTADLGAFDRRLHGLGSSLVAHSEIDRLGRPLRHPGRDLGPWGETAGDYDQEWRFSLSPAQLAQLEAASAASSVDSKLTTARANKLDTLPAAGTVATASNVTDSRDSILAKLLAYFRLALRKDAATATDQAADLAEINADAGSGAGAYNNATDSAEAVRDRGDSDWATGTGGNGATLLETTIATVTSQTVLVLTDGSPDNDAYNGRQVVITDQSTSTQKAVGVVADYVGSSKTLTLQSAPGFTVVAGDVVVIETAAASAVSLVPAVGRLPKKARRRTLTSRADGLVFDNPYIDLMPGEQGAFLVALEDWGDAGQPPDGFTVPVSGSPSVVEVLANPSDQPGRYWGVCPLGVVFTLKAPSAASVGASTTLTLGITDDDDSLPPQLTVRIISPAAVAS